MLHYAQVVLVLTLCVTIATAYPYVSEAPTVENTDYGTLVVKVTFGDANPIVGTGRVTHYIVQYRKEEERWKSFVKVDMPEVAELKGGYSRNFTITGLESGVVYNVRVLLADKHMNSYQGDLVPIYIIPTMCYLPEDYDYQVISTRKENTLIFSWTYKNQNKRWCPILTYQVTWGENNTWKKYETPQSRFQIPDYDPTKVIQFKVRTVSTGGYAPFSESLNYDASHSEYPYVSVAPTSENTDYGTLEVNVTFGDSNPIMGTGRVAHYIVQYRKEGDPWKILVKVDMPEVTQLKGGYSRNFTITGLESGVVYNVRVLLADKQMNSYDGDLVPIYYVPTMCYLPEEYDYQITPIRKRDNLSFAWTYKNQNERWCPILTYQVTWGENNTWKKYETPQSRFKIPDYDPTKAIQFKVRTVTTGGYAPFSEIVNYDPPHQGYPYVSEAPTVENTDYGTLEVNVTFGDSNPIVGTGTVTHYILQYRKEGNPWISTAKVEMPMVTELKGGYSRNFTITGLESGVVYNVRLLLADEQMNSYDGDLVPIYIVPTMCYLPEEYDYQVVTTRFQENLTFSWTYENENERWCPILSYQVNWAENDTWRKHETPLSSYQIPDYDPTKVIQFKVRAVTTGWYAPYSETVYYDASRNVSYIIENLKVVKMTFNSVVLQWEYDSSDGKSPESFFIHIEELENGVHGDCCQVISDLKIPAKERHSIYEAKIEDLKPTAKYKLTISPTAPVLEAENSKVIKFTTPPPPLPVEVPKVRVNTHDDWSWMPQALPFDEKSSNNYKQFLKHYLLLVLPEDYDPADESGITHQKINQLLNDVIKKQFFVASHYKQGEEVTLEDGKRGELEWGGYHNKDLPTGKKHKMAAVQISEFDEALAADVVYSTIFTAAP